MHEWKQVASWGKTLELSTRSQGTKADSSYATLSPK